MRAWRRSLPVDRLRDVDGAAGVVRWSSAARFRRYTVAIDIPIESSAGMDGAYGTDHPH